MRIAMDMTHPQPRARQQSRGIPAHRDPLRALAVRSLRQALTDHARERLALEGAGDMAGGIDAIDPADRRQFEQLVKLDDALFRLALEQPRQARVFECRYFGGLDDDETAEALAISPRTAQREWLASREWLARAIGAPARSH